MFSRLCSLLSCSFFLINWLAKSTVFCFIFFFFFWFCFSPFFFVLRQGSALYIFPTLPVVVGRGNRVATQDYVSWCAAEDETRETEHWTAIKEPPTLAWTLRHLRYLWSCYWRGARVITMRVYNPFLAVRLHHSFVSFYPFYSTSSFPPACILSLFMTFLLLLLLLLLLWLAYACLSVRLFVGNYQVAGRRGTWFSFFIADRPTRWLKEKFERFVSSAAGSLARRKPKCLSNKPITSSKRQDPIFIASTPARRKGDSQVWISDGWRWNEGSLLCRISSWLHDWTHWFIRPKKKIISTSNKFLVEKGLTFFFFKSATCNQTQIVAKANNYRILPWILK